MVGDSFLRQSFISAGCNNLNLVREYSVDWAKGYKWPCHGTPNCINEGEHSGFNTGSILWKGGGELHFIPHYGSMKRYERGILQRWTNELAVSGKLTLGPNVEHTEGGPNLQADDVIVYVAGYHNTHAQHREQVQVAASFGTRLAEAGKNAPFFMYVMTPTQHFPGDLCGGYVRTNANAAACLKHASDDRRMTAERELLAHFKGKNQIMTLLDAHDLGGLHVGNGDCTHYCQPGVPDVMAKKLFEDIAKL
jgi:hypothetical protein